MAITMRKGAYADFDPSKMKAGEWAVSTDTDTTKQQIWMCFAPGVVKRMGTVEDFDTEIQTLIKQYLDGMAESVEKAQESVELATSKAQESSDSADKAKASEDKAKEYEESAYSTITTINEAAEATRLNKEAAAQSEANAKASENEALSYKNSASDSEQASKTSETNAKTYADNASASATSASTSATDASESKTSASASASQAKTSETNAKTSEINSAKNESEAQKYAEQAKEISESLSGALRPLGTINFADLPTTAESTAGDMYNIADQFTTTADFKEGSGNVIPAGSNVYLTVDRYWDVLAGTPVTGVKGAKENYYRRGNVDITPANIGAIAEDGDISDTTVTFADTTTRVNLASGEKVAVGFGKIKKWLADLKSFAFNDLVNNLTTSTTGSALDASQGKILNDRCDELNQSLEETYEGTPSMDYLNTVFDCSFILHPKTKRVDIQVVGTVKKTMPDWTPVVTIPSNLPIANDNQAYCGTVMTSDGKLGVCYISPSRDGTLSVWGISASGKESIIKIFGSYYTR